MLVSWITGLHSEPCKQLLKLHARVRPLTGGRKALEPDHDVDRSKAICDTPERFPDDPLDPITINGPGGNALRHRQTEPGAPGGVRDHMGSHPPAIGASTRLERSSELLSRPQTAAGRIAWQPERIKHSAAYGPWRDVH
jgi:hypothetical protein